MAKKNRLAKENCNKAKCRTCIFREDGSQLELAPGRLDEIKKYLAGSSSHECHISNKTCYGGLEYQAMAMHQIGIIKENSVDCFLRTAAEVLKF